MIVPLTFCPCSIVMLLSCFWESYIVTLFCSYFSPCKSPGKTFISGEAKIAGNLPAIPTAGMHIISWEHHGVCRLLLSESRFPVFLFSQKSVKLAVLWTKQEWTCLVHSQAGRVRFVFLETLAMFPLLSLQCPARCLFPSYTVFPFVPLSPLHHSMYFFSRSPPDLSSCLCPCSAPLKYP